MPSLRLCIYLWFLDTLFEFDFIIDPWPFCGLQFKQHLLLCATFSNEPFSFGIKYCDHISKV